MTCRAASPWDACGCGCAIASRLGIVDTRGNLLTPSTSPGPGTGIGAMASMDALRDWAREKGSATVGRNVDVSTASQFAFAGDMVVSAIGDAAAGVVGGVTRAGAGVAGAASQGIAAGLAASIGPLAPYLLGAGVLLVLLRK